MAVFLNIFAFKINFMIKLATDILWRIFNYPDCVHIIEILRKHLLLSELKFFLTKKIPRPEVLKCQVLPMSYLNSHGRLISLT